MRQENAVLKADGKGLKRLKILFRFRNFLPIGFPVGFLSFNRMFSESWGGEGWKCISISPAISLENILFPLNLLFPHGIFESQKKRDSTEGFHSDEHGKEIGKIVLPPYKLAVPVPKSEKHVLELKLYLSRINTFGALHAAVPIRWKGSNMWYTQDNAWAYEYQLTDVGIMKKPVLRMRSF